MSTLMQSSSTALDPLEIIVSSVVSSAPSIIPTDALLAQLAHKVLCGQVSSFNVFYQFGKAVALSLSKASESLPSRQRSAYMQCEKRYSIYTTKLVMTSQANECTQPPRIACPTDKQRNPSVCISLQVNRTSTSRKIKPDSNRIQTLKRPLINQTLLITYCQSLASIQFLYHMVCIDYLEYPTTVLDHLRHLPRHQRLRLCFKFFAAWVLPDTDVDWQLRFSSSTITIPVRFSHRLETHRIILKKIKYSKSTQ